MLFHEGVYYWYGEFKEGPTWAPESNKSWGGTRVVAMGVSCYSSTNLYDWEFRGLVLPAVKDDESHDLHRSKVIERPKVIYNRQTRKFVMWMHIDSEDYKAARAGMAISDSPVGPFHYLGSIRPHAGIWPQNATAADKRAHPSNYLARDFEGGQMARDMTLFQDDDGKAYWFYSSEENATMHVALLSDDYLKPSGIYVRIFPGRSMEAPAVFKRNGKYYLIASGCTGWEPNAARSGVAENILGPWRELENPWRGADAELSYHSQSTYVQPVHGLPDTYLFMADRWNSTNLPDSRYIWFPLRFEANGQPRIEWQDNWSFPERRSPNSSNAANQKQTEAKTSTAAKHTFAIGPNDFLLDGKPFLIRCGEIHAPRVPPEYWRHRLQMAKAMGLNTVCAYLFWNLHEPRPGEFNWSGEADAAEFCRIAQEEGLWVILRPGPYACAEWEMGGTPWWLLKHDDIQLRSRDPRYLNAAKRYLNEVARVLGPLQITRGGPILMVQVENEYGFYGKDAEYMGELRQVFIDAGFDVPLFACNPVWNLKDGYRDDLFPVVNFGSDPAGAFKALRQILPEGKGPLMCGEFYPGWFDTWGAPHHKGNTGKYLADLEYMLKHNASFSIYMAHGGTTFGLWAGCDRPFKPDTSSYDYDAPISEAGWTTDKFFKTRELFSRYLNPGETIPEPPAKNPVINFVPVTLSSVAPIFKNLPTPLHDEQPQSMEKYDQGFGCILYRTTIPAGPATTLEAAAIKDFGFVFLDGERIGVMDRRSGKAKLNLPARTNTAQLDILVEPMGRVNFGPEMKDPKGLIAPLKLGGEVLKGWQVFNLSFNQNMLATLNYSAAPNLTASGNTNALSIAAGHAVEGCFPAFWRGMFEIEKPGDTFLDLRTWGKGVVWVNGHCLARFWNIGPTQTAYIPGCWLKPGKNEIIIWDLIGPTSAEIAGLATPILDQLRPELDFARSHRAEVTLKLTGIAPTHTGTFAAGSSAQEVKFAQLARGKFFCLESQNAHDNQPYAAVAELDLLDASGKPLARNNWTIAYVSSEERIGEDGTAENAIDGQTANFWHSEWQNAKPNHPHRLILNLGSTQTISGFRYVPRQSAGGGRIKDYRVFVGDLIEMK